MRRLRVLIVDDSVVMRRMISDMVLSDPALEQLQQGPLPAVVIVDWNMPELNGLDMVRAVRANPAWTDIRLIMITSENELERVQTALEAGADEYIMKPFNRDVLLDKLAQLPLG